MLPAVVRPFSPTALFLALTLLPAVALAWLGWAANAALVDELRRTARDEALRVARDVAGALPVAVDFERQRARAVLASIADRVAATLPTSPPGIVLDGNERELGDGALRIVGVDGRTIAPCGPRELERRDLPEWPRLGRALTAVGDARHRAAAALRTPALRARALANLVADGGDAAAALVELRALPGPTVVAAGPAVVEALLRSDDGRARLRALDAEGWLLGVPATAQAHAGWLHSLGADGARLLRQQLRVAAEVGADLVVVDAALPGGARVEWLRRRPDVLAALRVPIASAVCTVALEPAVTAAPAHWIAAATAALAVDSPFGAVAIRAEHTGLAEVETNAASRRAWLGTGIALLLLTVVSGAALARRAVANERAAARLRDDFLANVSHELKTPLTSLRLYAEMLGDPALDAAARRRYAAVALAEGARLSAMVDDLLDFAALQRGKRRLEPEPVDLAAAARAFAAGHAPLCARDDVALDVALDRADAPALADTLALARIAANLLQNALRHGKPARDGGRRRIRLCSGPGPRLEVRDNGPGIPPPLRERIFERFERARHGGQGIGLGLALSRELARAMGGELTCGDDGRETVFALALPAAPRHDATDDAADDEAASAP